MRDYNEFLNSKKKKRNINGINIEIVKLNTMLFDFQKDIVRWSLGLGKAAIFLDCGLGKTPIQLEWAKIVNESTMKPVLILAPLAVSRQTKHEGDKFGIMVNICKDQNDVSDGINITNYERIERFDISQFSGVVLDESSILRDFSGKFRNYIIGTTADTAYKLACTATPAPNDYIELGNHSEFLNALSRKEMLATFFINDTAHTGTWRLKGHAQQAFWEWMSEWSIMMKNPADFGYDGSKFILPLLNISEHIIRTDAKQDEFLFALPAVTLGEQRVAKRVTIGERSEYLSKLINGSDEQWLVWCELNDESRTLTSMIDGVVEITGSDSGDYKEQCMLDFANGITKILVTKPSIAGHGMNWQNCHNVAFVGLSHSWESYYQATRRCWRYGQTRQVNSHIIISDMEMRILDNVKRKEEAYQNMYDNMLDNTHDFMISKIRGCIENKEEYYQETYQGENYSLVRGDCVEAVKDISDGSIHLAVFSPPFSSLYTYTDLARDMGNSTDRHFYEHFEYLARELERVIKQGRIVAMHCSDVPAMIERDGYQGLKDLSGYFIRIMEDAGFRYFSRVTIWKNPAVEMQRTKAHGLLHKTLKKDASKVRVGIPDYILIFRKPGINPEPIVHNDISVDTWQDWASPVWMDIRQTRTLATIKYQDDERHMCPLQLDVIERLISLYSNHGDIVFSPFAGIGSEGYIAIQMGRRFLGIELKPEYYKQAIENLKMAEQETGKLLFGVDV